MYQHDESFRSGGLLGGIAGASDSLAAAQSMADQVGSAMMQHTSGFFDLLTEILPALF